MKSCLDCKHWNVREDSCGLQKPCVGLSKFKGKQDDARRIKVLEEEIQQLKFQNNCLKKDLAGVSKCCETTEEENEQLEDTIKRLEGHNTLLLEDIQKSKEEKEHIEEVYKNIVEENEKLKQDIQGFANVIKVLGAIIC